MEAQIPDEVRSAVSDIVQWFFNANNVDEDTLNRHIASVIKERSIDNKFINTIVGMVNTQIYLELLLNRSSDKNVVFPAADQRAVEKMCGAPDEGLIAEGMVYPQEIKDYLADKAIALAAWLSANGYVLPSAAPMLKKNPWIAFEHPSQVLTPDGQHLMTKYGAKAILGGLAGGSMFTIMKNASLESKSAEDIDFPAEIRHEALKTMRQLFKEAAFKKNEKGPSTADIKKMHDDYGNLVSALRAYALDIRNMFPRTHNRGVCGEIKTYIAHITNDPDLAHEILPWSNFIGPHTPIPNSKLKFIKEKALQAKSLKDTIRKS